jgi:hypothetical protein
MSDMPRTVLANIVSETVAERPSAEYRRAMAAVTPRKLWQARPGDCVVMLAPCSDMFRDYVARVIDLDVDRVTIVAPPQIRGEHALDVADALGATAEILERPILKPFVLDARVIDFGQETGVSILPYPIQPDASLLEPLSMINTKHGFRETARQLGLPIADGGVARTRSELVGALAEFLVDHAAAIVKPNRSSNGFGNTVIQRGRLELLHEQVDAAIGEQPDRACGWIYEEFLQFTAIPSIEMAVHDDGVDPFYTCDQRSVNNAWRGMVTPAAQGPHLAELVEAATLVGRWLFERGYRGIFDVDCGVHDDGAVVTEANVRTTGGTYLHNLARLLRSDLSTVHWRADVRLGASGLDFGAGVRALDAAGLTDASASARAVLTVDTREVDGKWR